MNYEFIVADMLKHVDESKKPSDMIDLLHSFAVGVAGVSAMVNSMDVQAELLEKLFTVIRAMAKDIYLIRHQGCSQEDYLKHIYKPGKHNA